MIVCSCRRISNNDHKSEAELKKRLRQKDVKCGKCLSKKA